MPSRLRQELLQRGPAGSKAAATLPTSTTATAPKYPVEAAPVPSNDDVVLGEADDTGGDRAGSAVPLRPGAHPHFPLQG